MLVVLSYAHNTDNDNDNGDDKYNNSNESKEAFIVILIMIEIVAVMLSNNHLLQVKGQNTSVVYNKKNI